VHGSSSQERFHSFEVRCWIRERYRHLYSGNLEFLSHVVIRFSGRIVYGMAFGAKSGPERASDLIDEKIGIL
jgi:hypothetical protein